MGNMNSNPLYTILIAILLTSLISCEQETSPSEHEMITRMDSISYIVGNNLAYQSVGIDLNPEMVYQGFRDGKDTVAPVIERGEADRLLNTFRTELQSEQSKRIQQEAVSNKIIGGKFLEENRKQEGVVESASGLQYIILKEGEGEMPSMTSIVTTRFTGTLIDGTIFDTTEGTGPNSGPRSFEVVKVIEGWKEALLQMKPGSKWKLFIPAELAYGETLRDPIPPNSVLIFELSLTEVSN